jgi:hypothetical protein
MRECPALVTAGHGVHDGPVQAPGEESDLAGDDPSAALLLEERGSFTHAVCLVCGWSGPGRRSRERARKDVVGHRARDCPR